MAALDNPTDRDRACAEESRLFRNELNCSQPAGLCDNIPDNVV
jgi:hypothetical protein